MAHTPYPVEAATHAAQTLTHVELESYIGHQLKSNSVNVTMYYTNGETETNRVTGVSSYLYHGERVVRLGVAEYFSDVFYFSRESFRFADNRDILTFMRDNETPHTRISFGDYCGEEEKEEEGEQLYYCYSLRSRERRTPTGELMYGYSWDGDYIATFCYGREQLKKYLTADMKVVRVSLAHNCKPRHTLP